MRFSRASELTMIVVLCLICGMTEFAHSQSYSVATEWSGGKSAGQARPRQDNDLVALRGTSVRAEFDAKFDWAWASALTQRDGSA
jgi:hypothetical protein